MEIISVDVKVERRDGGGRGNTLLLALVSLVSSWVFTDIFSCSSVVNPNNGYFDHSVQLLLHRNENFILFFQKWTFENFAARDVLLVKLTQWRAAIFKLIPHCLFEAIILHLRDPWKKKKASFPKLKKNPSIRVVVELSAGPDSTFVSLSTNN